MREVGHGMWVEWVALLSKRELTEGMASLESEGFWRVGDELVRRWEEVDVQVESESGEVRSDRVPVPSCAMPHTFSILFNACSAVHQVCISPSTFSALLLVILSLYARSLQKFI